MTSKQTEAAALVAQGRLTNEKIAKKIGIGERTLDAWKRRPEFQAAVEKLQAAVQKAAQESLIADKKYRLSVLEDLMRRYQRIIYERSKDPEMKGIPGGKTGLVLVKFRPIKTVEDVPIETEGADGKPVVTGSARVSKVKLIREHMADTGLAAEIRALCEHIATETGDWKQKHELTGPNGEPLVPKQPLPSCILAAIQQQQAAAEKKE